MPKVKITITLIGSTLGFLIYLIWLLTNKGKICSLGLWGNPRGSVFSAQCAPADVLAFLFISGSILFLAFSISFAIAFILNLIFKFDGRTY